MKKSKKLKKKDLLVIIEDMYDSKEKKITNLFCFAVFLFAFIVVVLPLLFTPFEREFEQIYLVFVFAIILWVIFTILVIYKGIMIQKSKKTYIENLKKK